MSKALYSSLPLIFLGPEFSAPEAVGIFSVVLDRPVLKTSMRQRLLKMTEAGYLQETGRKKAVTAAARNARWKNLKPTSVYLFLIVVFWSSGQRASANAGAMRSCSLLEIPR
nr:hypothetical protein GCM10020185_33350 [Pseudomonas brassicacearum subsp. brassicacearum]